MYCCNNLNFEIASKFLKELTNIHNLIPFQNWHETELLCDHDETRFFYYKWLLSSVSFYLDAPVGLCTGFIHNNLKWQPKPFMYFHRLAVLPTHRNAGLGKALFLKSLLQISRASNLGHITDVILQTPILSKFDEKFVNVEWYYQNMGFIRIELKEYQDKIDSVMHCRLDSLIHNLTNSLNPKIIYND
jgi:GNAT superfamily N-acetyltransferase